MKNMSEGDQVCLVINFEKENRWFGFAGVEDVPENIRAVDRLQAELQAIVEVIALNDLKKVENYQGYTWQAYVDGNDLYILPVGGW